MAGVTYSDYGTSGSGTVVSPVTVNWNSGNAPASGTVLLAFVSGSGALGTLTVPSGWTAAYNYTNSGSVSNYQLCGAFYKIAGASEPTGVTWTSSTTNQVIEVTMVAYTGATNATPVAAHSTTSGTSLACPTATAPANNSLLVANWGSGNSVTALSTPSGTTLRATAGFGNGIGNITAESNTLYSGTSGAFTSAITGTNFAMNSFIFLLAPSATPVTLTDTGPSVSDSIGFTATVPYSLTDTGPSISDSISLLVYTTVVINLTDTGPTISDSVTQTQGPNFAFADTIATQSDIMAVSAFPIIIQFGFTDTLTEAINDSIFIQVYGVEGSGNWTQTYLSFGEGSGWSEIDYPLGGD